jgi:hypothetical protein
MRINKSLLLGLSCGVILSACTSSRLALEGQHDNFGSANKANIQAHAVTPDPAKKADTYIPADRERVRAAREAYREGKVKELEPMRSQSD